MPRNLAALIIAALAATAAPPTAAAELQSVAVEGTEFIVTLGDGAVLRSRDLAGAVLTVALDGQAARLRIDALERDPDATRGEVWLHTLSAQAADGSWQNLCSPGPD